MTSPVGHQKARFGLEALRCDAAVWDANAAMLDDAARASARLNLVAEHFSAMGDNVGLTARYAEIQDQVATLLGEGAENFRSLAKVLRSAADHYESADARSAAEFGMKKEK